MSPVTGINHVAIMTADLDRFVAFYTEVFELEVAFAEDRPEFRHAMVMVAPGAVLHAIEMPGNRHGAGQSAMTDRGHLDHLGLTVTDRPAFDRVLERLVERSASSGEVDDLGAVHSAWFTDPDGMRGEVVLVLDSRLRGMHEPRPLAPVAASPQR